ncbi:MAG: DUF2254 domain-containing protein [Candidatus Eremiobacteraeota bacterium]|nr:DUF2254 domain-containing protein [Candidatus Eremiobacteraeota bacterium]
MNRSVRWPSALLFRKVVASLYFFPTTIVGLSIALAVGLLWLGPSVKVFQALGTHWGGDADSARAFLSTVASSMMGIAGVAFSVVVVALTLASNQFCPRVLRHFVEDRVNRVFFGLLLGNFSYAVTVLGAISDQSDELPGLALLACFAYVLLTTGVFIYFIHHLASGLQIDAIVRVVAYQTETQIDRLKRYQRLLGPALPAPPAYLEPEQRSRTVLADDNGYVQAVDLQELLKLSAEWSEPIHLLVGDGDYVTQGTPLLEPLDHELDEDERQRVCEAFELGHQRYLDEDISYGFREIADIAIKAISPAINDPTTAAFCLDTLACLMLRLAKDGWPPACRDDENGASVTLTRNQPEYYLRLCCLQITHFAQNDPMVLLGLLHFLARVKPIDDSQDWNKAVKAQLDAVVEAARAGQLAAHLVAEIETLAAGVFSHS